MEESKQRVESTEMFWNQMAMANVLITRMFCTCAVRTTDPPAIGSCRCRVRGEALPLDRWQQRMAARKIPTGTGFPKRKCPRKPTKSAQENEKRMSFRVKPVSDRQSLSIAKISLLFFDSPANSGFEKLTRSVEKFECSGFMAASERKRKLENGQPELSSSCFARRGQRNISTRWVTH